MSAPHMHHQADHDSPRLNFCPETLPREAYVSPDRFAAEMRTIFSNNWIMVGRLRDLPAGTLRALHVGLSPVLLVRTVNGDISAYHNTCRHRGSELCGTGEDRKIGKLISCPYHAWSFAADDGRLVSTGYAHPTPDFSKQDHGLLRVAHQVWNGFIFLNLSESPRPLAANTSLETLDRWPTNDLITGHRWEHEVECNWKVFWENFSECLHCPGVHPELCELVPIYGTGVSSARDAHDWDPNQSLHQPLRSGAESWTSTGAPCGPVFEGLTEAERERGATFVVFWPTAYVVAHVDYIRSVRLEPLTPTRMKLVAEWYFSAETLAQPGFDPVDVAAFAKLVLEQDSAASAMNQRGIASPAFSHGRLMPEEHSIHRFHEWIGKELDRSPADVGSR